MQSHSPDAPPALSRASGKAHRAAWFKFGDAPLFLVRDLACYFSAKENTISVLITRNSRHYKTGDMIVETSEEYIKSKEGRSIGSG
jgi:hypothetical protein